jgi:DNA-binding NtrC family response regulator
MSIVNVLVVDDDLAVCGLIQRMLPDNRYSVQASQSVGDAFRAIEQNCFDVYILDYKLLDGSGLDVAERIRSKRGAAPFILISGYDPSAVALRADQLGISNFVQKPFSKQIILNAVSKAIACSCLAAGS